MSARLLPSLPAFPEHCEMKIWSWLIIILITLIQIWSDTNVTRAESRPWFSTRRKLQKKKKNERKQRELTLCKSQTVLTWHQRQMGENVENMGENMGRNQRRARIRTRTEDTIRDSPEKFCSLCWFKPPPAVCMSNLLSRFDHTGTKSHLTGYQLSVL